MKRLTENAKYVASCISIAINYSILRLILRRAALRSHGRCVAPTKGSDDVADTRRAGERVREARARFRRQRRLSLFDPGVSRDTRARRRRV